MPLAVKAQNPNHWTAREFSKFDGRLECSLNLQKNITLNFVISNSMYCLLLITQRTRTLK